MVCMWAQHFGKGISWSCTLLWSWDRKVRAFVVVDFVWWVGFLVTANSGGTEGGHLALSVGHEYYQDTCLAL